MTLKKTLATSLCAAVLILANTGMAFTSNLHASAQLVEIPTISTSADSQEGKFFGEGVIRLVITDRSTDDDGDDVIIVDIEAESDGSSGYDSGTFAIPNTNPGSQKFEFFLVHAGSQYADGIANDGTALDATNSEGFDDPSDGFDGVRAPIIRFGTDSGSGVELETGDSLYEQVNFEVRYDTERLEFSYEESDVQVLADRDVYGSDNFVYIAVRDQDANLNPTEPDSFNLTTSDLETLFEIAGARFVDDVTFTETSDNSALFKARLLLANSDSENDAPELVFLSTAITLVIRETANYANVSGPENNQRDTSQTGFTIKNGDGLIDKVDFIAFGSELKLVLLDNDQNKDSENDETLNGVVKVAVESGDSNSNGVFEQGEFDEEVISMEETGDDTGTFIIDGSNNELKVSFLADGENPVPNNGILEIRQSDTDRDITVAYRDRLDADSAESVTASFRARIQLVPGQISLPEQAGINDEVILSITDSDLNNNARTRDSYSFILSGSSGSYGLRQGGKPISSLASIEIEIGGSVPTFADSITYVMTETNVSSGVFNATIDLRELFASAGVNADDGDLLDIRYVDKMGRTSRESSSTLTVQRSSIAVDFSRDILPIPPVNDESDPAPESSVGQLVGDQAVTTLLVTDVLQNTQSGSENTIPFRFRNDPGGPSSSFSIRVDGDGFDVTVDSTAKYNGTDPAGRLGNTGLFLADIIPDLPTLRETGRSTGLFDSELRFVNDGTMETDKWHDLQIVFSYFNSAGESERGGVVFRGNTGFLSISHDSVAVGAEITITVQDEDLNLNDGEVEEFRTSQNTNGIYLLAIEPDDDEIETRSTSQGTFKETGTDTGEFTASFIVGKDIPVSEIDGGDLNHARIIRITYNDEADSSGRSGDELELEIPVVTSTGSIQVMPDQVGPATQLTILIVDSDLNFNPLRTDKFEGDSEGKGIVTFRTDRKEAGRASPDLEETGPNSGVFRFEIMLVPIEGGDDGEPIEVDGGSTSRIGVLPGDLIAIRYEDGADESGRSTFVSAVIDITSWDPVIELEEGDFEENDRVTIVITDPDANRSPDISDSIRGVRVYGESDRVGRVYSALETGRDSGVFRLSFFVSSGTQSGAVTGRNGDEITISYEDEFPGDYAQKLTDREKTDKTFLYSFVLGLSRIGINTTSPSAPVVTDVAGSEVSEIVVGSQVVLSTTVINNNAVSLPILVILEVRNSEQVTESLVWQTGNLVPQGSTNMGVSWLPQRSGNYEVRTFVISDLERAEVLSPVVGAEVIVV